MSKLTALHDFTDFTDDFREFINGDVSADGLVERLGQPMVGRTPNPQRVCFAIEAYDIMAPIIGPMFQPPVVLPIIPLPAYCTTPPTPAGMDLGEMMRVHLSVVRGMYTE